MARTNRWLGSVALASVALMLSACAAPFRVNAYVERGTDLSRYRTFDFAPVEAVPTGDPRLDSNPFFYGRVREAVEQQLGTRGYEKTTTGTPDFRVHVHASATQDIDVSEADRRSGYCSLGDCRPFVYDAGTLLLDFVDARTNKLVWRGWAEGTLDGVVDNQAWMEQRIDAAVAKIMAKLRRHS